MVPFCTPFNGGSFILLKAKCCSHRFLHVNHIHLTLVHLEEETLSVSPPVSPLARLVRVKSVCHGACYCFWQPSLNSGRPCQRLKDLKSFRYDFTSHFGCSRSRKRKAKDSHSPCVGKLVPFNMAFLLFTAAPLWPETQAGESDEGFKRGRRETQLDTMPSVFLFPILWCNNRHLDIFQCIYHIFPVLLIYSFLPASTRLYLSLSHYFPSGRLILSSSCFCPRANIKSCIY